MTTKTREPTDLEAKALANYPGAPFQKVLAAVDELGTIDGAVCARLTDTGRLCAMISLRPGCTIEPADANAVIKKTGWPLAWGVEGVRQLTESDRETARLLAKHLGKRALPALGRKNNRIWFHAVNAGLVHYTGTAWEATERGQRLLASLKAEATP